MDLGDDAADLVVDYVRLPSSGAPHRVRDSGIDVLYELVARHPAVVPALETLRAQPADVGHQDRFRHSLRGAALDPAFAAALAAATRRARAEQGEQARVQQSAQVTGTISAPVEVVQAGRDVYRADHIGDKIKNIYQTKQGKIGILVAVVVVLGLVAALLVFGDDDTPTAAGAVGEIAPSTAPTRTTAMTTTTTAAPAAPGAVLRSGKELVVESTGHVIVVAEQNATGDTTLTTIDIATGGQAGGFTLTAPVPPGSARKERCEYTAVRAPVGDLVLSFEKSFEMPQGTVPSKTSRRLVARKAADGTEVWRTEARTKTGLDSVSAKASTGCDGGLPKNSITADGAHAWVRFFPDDEPQAVDLTSGRTRPQPGTMLMGNYVAVPFHPSTQVGSVPERVDIVSPADGSIAGQTTDPEVGRAVEGDLVTVSPDGKVLVLRNNEGERLRALSLPAATALWEQAPADGPYIYSMAVDPTADIVLSTPSLASSLVGDSLRSGQNLWAIPEIDTYCGLHAGKAYVMANGQLAVIDLVTGAQLSFDPSTTQCPRVLRGVMVKEDSVVKL